MYNKLNRIFFALILAGMTSTACAPLMLRTAEPTQVSQHYTTEPIEFATKEWDRTSPTPVPMPTATIGASQFDTGPGPSTGVHAARFCCILVTSHSGLDQQHV